MKTTVLALIVSLFTLITSSAFAPESLQWRKVAAVTITFDNISNMERDTGGGIGWAKALGIGLGAGAGVFLTIFIIALQLD